MVDLDSYGELSRDLIKLIDAGTARKEAAVPLALDGNTLTIVLRNPLNYQAVDEFRFVLNKEIIQVVAPENQVDAATVKKHFDMVLTKVQETAKKQLGRFLGKTVCVLCEGKNEQDAAFMDGRMSENTIVHFPGDESMIGKFYDIKLTAFHGFYYDGEIVDKAGNDCG